jgi:hypothetical protein
MKFAEDELKTALTKTNTFFSDKWKIYKETIENLEVSPFKETKSFSMD